MSDFTTQPNHEGAPLLEKDTSVPSLVLISLIMKITS